jgi:hypothetical protein
MAFLPSAAHHTSKKKKLATEAIKLGARPGCTKNIYNKNVPELL